MGLMIPHPSRMLMKLRIWHASHFAILITYSTKLTQKDLRWYFCKSPGLITYANQEALPTGALSTLPPSVMSTTNQSDPPPLPIPMSPLTHTQFWMYTVVTSQPYISVVISVIAPSSISTMTACTTLNILSNFLSNNMHISNP